MKIKKKKKVYNPYRRKLHIGGEEWSYRIGGWSILIKSPDSTKTYKLNCRTLNGCKSCGDYDYHCNCPITPSLIKKYISRHILEKIDADYFIEML